MDVPEKEKQGRVKELARLFLRLGATAFGGPAAQIAIMHDETVRRKKWLDDKSFLDLIGAVNLIPGPNSTEVAIHIGYLRAGWRGLVTAGACFIIPAAVIVTALTWVYVQYGSTPEGNHFFYGIKPVIIAVILQAIVFIGRKAVTEPVAIATGIAAAVAYMFGVNEIALLFLGGLFVMLWKNIGSMRGGSAAAFLIPFLGLDGAAAEAKGASLMSIFLVFLKIGSVLYGSGYVLLAFLNSDFVEHRGWLTHQQLLDVVAIGQVTPGPWFTTATAIGYLLGGVPGAALATLGIFLPSFIFVAISNPLIPRIRKSPWAGAALDGVNAASLGLMAGVMVDLAKASFPDPLTVLIGLAAAGALFLLRVNPTWLMLAGGAVGLLTGLL
ncbi:MAG: chromate efflux transporter, partial [Candidatus Dadabacteria bacterium]